MSFPFFINTSSDGSLLLNPFLSSSTSSPSQSLSPQLSSSWIPLKPLSSADSSSTSASQPNGNGWTTSPPKPKGKNNTTFPAQSPTRSPSTRSPARRLVTNKASPSRDVGLRSPTRLPALSPNRRVPRSPRSGLTTTKFRAPAQPKPRMSPASSPTRINRVTLAPSSSSSSNIANRRTTTTTHQHQVSKGFLSMEEMEAEEQAMLTLKHQLRVAHEIIPNLFLSGRVPAYTLETLRRHNVTHIVVVAADEAPMFPADFIYHHVHVFDKPDEDIHSHFETCNDFIEAAIKFGGKVLVHCTAGVSRSATIVASYLIRQRKMTTPNALQLIRTKRNIVKPNQGFLSQLTAYQKEKEKERGETNLFEELSQLASQLFSASLFSPSSASASSTKTSASSLATPHFNVPLSIPNPSQSRN